MTAVQTARDMQPPQRRSPRLPTAWLGGILLLGLVPCADARPTATQDTGTADYRHLESEIGFEYEAAPDGHAFVIAPAFTYGLTHRLETEISWDYSLENPDEEQAAQRLLTAFEFKSRFWEPAGEDGPSAGVKGKFAVPANVSGPHGATDPEGYVKFIYARPSGAAEIDYNLGYKYRGAWANGGNDKFFAGLCLRYRAWPRWQWLGEVFTEIPERCRREAIGVVAAGFKCKVREGLKGDLLIGTGLGHDAPSLRVSCGLVWAF